VNDRPMENGWLPDTPLGDTTLRRFLHNQAALNELAAKAGGGRVQRGTGVSLADTGGSVPYYNQAVLHRPLTGLDDPLLSEIEDFFRDMNGRPAMLLSAWPSPDLTARGWALVGHPAFVARSPGPVVFESKPGVVVRQAVSTADLAEVERVAIEGFNMSYLRGAPEGSMISPKLLDSPLTFRLAEVDGDVVAVSCNHVADGVNNLALAATLPNARRRGAWAALVWARVSDDPSLPALAYTSDDSRPGFERMGFLPILRFSLWLRAS